MDTTTPTRTGWPYAAPRTARRPTMAELAGAWQRRLIAWADGIRDTTTRVTWLQGRTWYVDLRQPQPRPNFTGVRGLRDLTGTQLAWLARQQGFAGQLASDPAEPACFTWARLIDFEPVTGQVDVGWLHVEDDILVERGRDLPYLEHWQRERARQPGETAALSLVDTNTGQRAVLVRVDDMFGYARARAHPLTGPASLPDAVAGADPRTAAALVDCEISLGTVTARGWRIQRSSLPYREGAWLNPPLAPAAGHQARTADVSPDGEPMTRNWDIADTEGDPRLLAALCVTATT